MTPFLAAGAGLPFLGEIVALLALSVAIAYLCYRVKLVPIVGFLIAGVVIGPYALGVVEDQELVDALAEIGVILLLFTIGVEFSLEKLNRIRRIIFLGGGPQTVITVALVALALVASGIIWPTAIFTGCLVALSSTAIVLKLLSDRDETDTPAGQFSLAILIFQDFAIILMVLLVPMLAGEGGSAWDATMALGRAAVIIALVIIVSRKVVPWLLDKVAKTRKQELFLLTVVLICLGTAWLMSVAGISLALGAFVAGLVVSESRYSEHALGEILPLRTVFNAIFFVSVGMLLDFGFLVRNLPAVLGIASAVLVLKAAVIIGVVLLVGFPVRIAATVGLTLAQIGEFSFVLERAGQVVELTPAGLGAAGTQYFIAVTVLLMALTPMLVRLAPHLGRRLERSRLGTIGEIPADEVPPVPELEDHVLIIGYGPAGQRLGNVLTNVNLPFIVLELNPSLIQKAQEDGVPVLEGDASRPHLLEYAGIERAKLCVVVINDEWATQRIVEVVHYLNPTIQVIARTRYFADIERLHRAGADIIVPEELETAVRIFSHVLGAYMIPRPEIERQIVAIRSDDYKVFRGSIHEAHLMVLQGLDEEGLHTRAVAVREGAPAANQTLADLHLRQRHQLTVLAVRRGRQTIGNPSGTFLIQPGDRLIMVGTADQFAACAELFRDTPPPELVSTTGVHAD